MTQNDFTIPENWQVERAAAAQMKKTYGFDDETAAYAGSLLVKKKTAILQELISKYAKPKQTATTATAPAAVAPEEDDFLKGWQAGAQPGTEMPKETRIEPGQKNPLYDPSDKFLVGWYAS